MYVCRCRDVPEHMRGKIEDCILVVVVEGPNAPPSMEAILDVVFKAFAKLAEGEYIGGTLLSTTAMQHAATTQYDLAFKLELRYNT